MVAIAQLSLVRAAPAARVGRIGRRSSLRAARTVVRAEAPETQSESAPSTSGSTVFYGGKSYTESEWREAVAKGTAGAAAPAASTTPPAAEGISELMAFAGKAPELINGRLAMLGFVAALGAELSSGESVLQQLKDEPTLIVATFGLIIAASFVPLLSMGSSAASDESVGPFKADAEMKNGRAAMIGFAAMLVIEALKGSALF